MREWFLPAEGGVVLKLGFILFQQKKKLRIYLTTNFYMPRQDSEVSTNYSICSLMFSGQKGKGQLT